MVFFLSDRIYWIYWIVFSFSQFPEETEKEESRYAGEITNRVVHFQWSGIVPIAGLTLEPSLAAFGGIGFCPSVWEGQKDNKNHVNPV